MGGEKERERERGLKTLMATLSWNIQGVMEPVVQSGCDSTYKYKMKNIFFRSNK